MTSYFVDYCLLFAAEPCYNGLYSDSRGVAMKKAILIILCAAAAIVVLFYLGLFITAWI